MANQLEDVRPEDVLCERALFCRPPQFFGQAVLERGVTWKFNDHSGNQVFHRLVQENVPRYQPATAKEKFDIVSSILSAIEDQNGRFLDIEGINYFTPAPNRPAMYVRQAFQDWIRNPTLHRWLTLPTTSSLVKGEILELLQNSPTLPPKSKLEERVSEELRRDRDIVLAFCQRDDLAQLHSERGFTVPDFFTSDKPIMMEYCGKVFGAFQQCCSALRSDYEVVRAALLLDGMNLRLVTSDSFRDDEELIRLACRSNARVLELPIPGHVRQSIMNDREFVVDSLERTPEAVGFLWRMAPVALKNELSFALLALKSGLPLQEIPPFFLKTNILVIADPYWSKLPTELQQDKDLVVDVIQHSKSLPPKADFEDNFTQELSVDQDVFMAFVQRKDILYLRQQRGFEVPDLFTSNKSAMMAYCQKIPIGLAICSNELRNDPDVVRAAVKFDPRNLHFASLDLVLHDAEVAHAVCLLDGPDTPRLHARFLLMSWIKERPELVGDIWEIVPLYLKKNDLGLIEYVLKLGLPMEKVSPECYKRLIVKDAPRYWSLLPQIYQRNKTYILEVLFCSPSLPSKTEFEGRLPKKLRKDWEVVFAFCVREDFAVLHAEGRFVLPECFKNDKNIMRAYCSEVPGGLQQCSMELRGDRDVVEDAVRFDGMNLQYVSRSLDLTEEDREALVRLACQSNSCAFQFCPEGPVRQAIWNDLDFVEEVLARNPAGLGEFWEFAPVELMTNARFCEIFKEVDISRMLEKRWLDPDYDDDGSTSVSVDTPRGGWLLV